MRGKSNKKAIKEGFKRIFLVWRLFFLTILSVTLITTYYSIESKKAFTYSTLGTLVVIFIITYFLGTKVFKKEGMIKNYFSGIWNIAVLGMILNVANLAVLITNSYFPLYLHEILAIASIVCTAMVIQKISFLKLI